MKILITGCAGFIGFHLSQKILKNKYTVFGIDNINSYYDVNIKKKRLQLLKQHKKFNFRKYDILDKKKVNNFVKKNKIKIIIHLAAQAGVRYSIKNPQDYFKSNIEGFFNILEISRENKIGHLIFASTSSVYGNNNNFPLKEIYNTDKPLTFYAASKKTNETMAYSYSNIYSLPSTALRFFTVYGPFGRPDMALFKFTDNIIKNKKVDLYNKGKHLRDFTYVDDIVEGIISIIKKPSKDKIPFNIFNIGNGKSKKLNTYLETIEKNLNKKAKVKKLPLQTGDVIKTHSDISKLNKYSGYKSKIDINTGIKYFIKWYLNYYKN